MLTSLASSDLDYRLGSRPGPGGVTLAASRASYHPAATHPFRTPVRPRASRVVGWVALATCPLWTVLILPDQVNAVAYLAGAGNP